MDEFSEKFQTAFDPPSFSENHIADFATKVHMFIVPDCPIRKILLQILVTPKRKRNIVFPDPNPIIPKAPVAKT